MPRRPGGALRIRIKTFTARIEKTETCWLWRGEIDQRGYGRYGGLHTHRVAYEYWVGPIPEGLEIDHLCRVTHCLNPEHLEPVTRAENMRRRTVIKTRCPRGHEFTEENTRYEGSARRCRKCVVINVRTYRQRKRADGK